MRRHKGKYKRLKGLVWTAGVLAVLMILIFGVNRWSVEVVLNGSDSVTLEYGDTLVDEGAQAYLRGSLIFKKGWPVSISEVTPIDESTIGKKNIFYYAEAFGIKNWTKRCVNIVDTTPPQLVLAEKEGTYTLPGKEYKEEGFTATDNYDGDLTDHVVSTQKDGVVYYSVTDSSGNEACAQRVIFYDDPIAPELTLKGEKEMTLEAGSAYQEPGYEASDNVDGDISDAVQVSGIVETNKVGTYILQYLVRDTYENTAEASRTVTVVDTKAPELKLKGKSKITLTFGTAFKEPGYTAEDLCDGDLTSAVKTEGSVDVSKAGTYTITYTVSDASGNQTSVKRTVVVEKKTEKPTPTPTVTPGNVTPNGKVIYLTFDDGPGKYTQKLLDVLEKYNVKATFFTVDNSYSYLLAKEAAAGHTVAIHSATHKYAQIYANEDAYFEDLYKQQNLILQQTGIRSTLVRFPGGSSNTVSKRYNKGIMTRLASRLGEMGYQYFDWNVSSGDAGGASTADEVFNNVVAGVKGKKVSVVLQHDSQGFSVDAVERIIVWGLQNGYTFLPLDASSPTVHHTIQN